jgi:myo-inositol-1(or 4)-monophosphatase
MRSWLETCRLCVADIREVLERLPTSSDREPVLRRGQGGDDTTAIDQAAEDAVVARLGALDQDFVLVSEELGERTFGEGGSRRVVVDPIDGSVNAKRGIPFFSFSLAVADGPTMGDVTFGYVYDFGSGEEWTATRGGGAQLDGRPLDGDRPKERVEILAMEGTLSAAVARKAEPLAGYATRFRIMGSLALALCQFAAGRVDAVCSLRAARSVDTAAAQLVVLERGLPIGFADAAPWEAAPLDLAPHGLVVAAPTQELTGRLAEILVM